MNQLGSLHFLFTSYIVSCEPLHYLLHFCSHLPRHVLISCGPIAFDSKEVSESSYLLCDMLKNYLTIAQRCLERTTITTTLFPILFLQRKKTARQ